MVKDIFLNALLYPPSTQISKVEQIAPGTIHQLCLYTLCIIGGLSNVPSHRTVEYKPTTYTAQSKSPTTKSTAHMDCQRGFQLGLSQPDSHNKMTPVRVSSGQLSLAIMGPMLSPKMPVLRYYAFLKHLAQNSVRCEKRGGCCVSTLL
jgi:hypothetical protein